MKKTLLIVTTFDYNGTRWGRNFPLASAFVRNGFDVTMLVTERRRSLKPYVVRDCEGVKVICFNAILPARIRKLPIGIFTTSFFVRMIYVLFHKFDYVYSDCGETPCSGWPCFLGKKLYKSKYLSEYGDLLGKGGYYDLKSKLYKIFFGPYFLWAIHFFRTSADYVIVLSNVMKQHVNDEMGIKDEKVILVPGGSIPEKIQYTEPDDLDGRPLYLTYIGVDDYEIRGILPLLNVIRNKYSNRIKVKLYGKKLSYNIIDKYSLNDIIVEYGWIDVIEGQDNIRHTDAFLLMRENLLIGAMGWPNKLGDYLSYGRPVMISPYGDLCEFVDRYPEGFIVVNRNNEKEIDNLFESILHSQINLIEMGKYNRQLAENVISWDARIKVLIAAINRMN